MEEIVKYIVDKLVLNHEAVEVSSEDREKETVINVCVAKEDMGKVIGRNGKIATAIRTLIRAAGRKADKKVNIKIDKLALNAANE